MLGYLLTLMMLLLGLTPYCVALIYDRRFWCVKLKFSRLGQGVLNVCPTFLTCALFIALCCTWWLGRVDEQHL